VDALARDHPNLAVELRELWAVAGMADAFAFPEEVDPNEPHAPALDAWIRRRRRSG